MGTVALGGAAALAGGAALYMHHRRRSSSGSRPSYPPGPHSHTPTHAHPLGGLADPQEPTIILIIADAGDESDSLRLRHDPKAPPAFKVRYREDGYAGEVFRGPLLTGSNARVGAWKVKHGRRIKFEFPRSSNRDPKMCKWDLAPEDEDWTSDVGILPDHWLKWGIFNESRGNGEVRFTLSCIDTTDDARSTVCKIVMQTYYDGRLEIPLRVVQNDEQLDEMVVMAVSCMDLWRDSMR
jgi:hypothetical protein